MVFSLRLRQARERAGLTQSELARRVGVKPQSIQALESGAAKSTSHLVAIARTLNVSADWLDRGEAEAGPEPRAGLQETYPGIEPAGFSARDLPIRGRAQAGSEGASMLAEDPPIDWTFRPPELRGVRDAFAMYVNDQSMEDAGLRHGTIIHVHPYRRPRPGDFVVVVRKSGDALIKRLVRTSDGKIVVRQTNPPREFSVALSDVRDLYLVTSAVFA